jgi:hypothetical protein
MKPFSRMCLPCFFIVLPFLIACCCDAPIESYAPCSPAEKEIVAVLAQYQDARNRFDLERPMPLLHEEGEFTFQCGMMV